MLVVVIVYIFRGELKGRSRIFCYYLVKNLFMLCNMYGLNFVFILFYRLRFRLIFILFCIFIIVIKIELILSLRELSVDYSGDIMKVFIKKKYWIV